MSTRKRISGGQAVIGVVVGVAVAVDRGFGPLPGSDGCQVEVDGHKVELGLEQAENAALIAAIGVRRGLPARAVSIALATAYQESKIMKIEHGEWATIGLLPQRP